MALNSYNSAAHIKTKMEQLIVTLNNIQRVRKVKHAEGLGWNQRSQEQLERDMFLTSKQLEVIHDICDQMHSHMENATDGDHELEADNVLVCEMPTNPQKSLYVGIRHPDLKDFSRGKLRSMKNIYHLVQTVQRVGHGGSLSIYPTEEGIQKFITHRSNDQEMYGYVQVKIDSELFDKALELSQMADNLGTERIDRDKLNIREFEITDLVSLYTVEDGAYKTHPIVIKADKTIQIEQTIREGR